MRAVRDTLKRGEFPLYWLSAVVGIYLATGGLLLGNDVPSEGFWDTAELPFIALVGSAMYVPLYALFKGLDAHYEGKDAELAKAAARRTEAEQDLILTCQQIAAAIDEACPAAGLRDLATQVWLCREDGAFDRRARFFLPAKRKNSGVEWTKGKGVAGWAWANGEDLSVDLTALHATLDNLGADGFDALPSAQRYGLTAHEVNNTRVYTGIIAIRLFSPEPGQPLVAIFVIDYTGTGDFECIRDAADSGHVRSFLATCEDAIVKEVGAGG